MRNVLIYVLAAGGFLLSAAISPAEVKIVTSTSDLAYFARVVGGDLVKVDAIASPKADVHYVEVRPSYMVKVNRARLALKIGLELDAWMDDIIDGSRNSNLEVIDCSRYIEPLEVPTFEPDARYGDLHPFGNPHYWLAPDNIASITQAVLEGLLAVDPEHAVSYRQNREAFLRAMEDELAALRSAALPLKGKEIISYHNSWPYFNAFTGLVGVGFIEPYPGVPPSPSHVAKLIRLIKKREIQVIVIEPYFDKRIPEKIAAETGATLIRLHPSTGGRLTGESYVQFLAGNINALVEAYR